MLRIAPIAVVLLVVVLAVGCGGDGEEAEVTPTVSAGHSPTAAASVAGTPTATPEVPAGVACPSADDAKGGETPYLRTGWETGDIVCWTDASGEVSYRVEGTVAYWVPPAPQECGDTPRPRPTLNEPLRVEFSEELPANTTRFQLPLHPEDGAGIKDYTILIDAVDAEGSVIVSGAASLTKDAFCESE